MTNVPDGVRNSDRDRPAIDPTDRERMMTLIVDILLNQFGPSEAADGSRDSGMAEWEAYGAAGSIMDALCRELSGIASKSPEANH